MNRLSASLALILAALLLAGCSSFRPWQNVPAQGVDAGLPTSGAVARPVVAAFEFHLYRRRYFGVATRQPFFPWAYCIAMRRSSLTAE